MSAKLILLPICCLLAMSAAGFYGVKVNPDKPGTFHCSRIVPKNFLVFEMTQPDGVRRVLQRNLEDPSLLTGDYPWIGEIRGDRITVMTNPEFKQGQTGFMFYKGELKLMLLDGEEYEIPSPAGGVCTKDISSLWKRDQLIAKMKTSDEYKIWRPGGRLRLWFENPNKAGAFLAGAALLSLILCFGRAKALKIIGGFLFFGFFIYAVMTSSRGALLGCATGSAVILLFSVKKYFSCKRVAILSAVLVAVLALMYILQGDRLTTGFFTEAKDDSTSRLPIWKEVPSMIVSAPSGWGLGMSGDAYVNWFQPLERFHAPRTLINSHFTWLVELSWPIRYLYVFGWIFLLSTLLYATVKGSNPVALAVWSAAGVAAIFNSVLEDWEVWAPLVISLTLALPSLKKVFRVKQLVCCVLSSMVVSGVILGGVFLSADPRGGDVPVYCNAKRVEVNGRNPSVWVVDDQWAFCGGYGGVLGKEIRMFYMDNPEAEALGYARDIAHLPRKINRLVLIGTSAEAFYSRWKADPSAVSEADEIVFFSPPFQAAHISDEFRQKFKTIVVHGGMTGLTNSVPTSLSSSTRIVPGAELYIPGWLRSVIGNKQKSGR